MTDKDKLTLHIVSATLNVSAGLDDRLVSLGLDSMGAVRLQRRLREQIGVVVPLRAFLGDTTVRDLTRFVAELEPKDNNDSHYHLSAELKEVGSGMFPLTPVQATYWVGRGKDFPLGGVSTYFYREYQLDETLLGHGVDAALETLQNGWDVVVRRHPMLRSVVGRDGVGQVLNETGSHRIEVHDLRNTENAARQLSQLRSLLSHRCVPAETWPIHTLAAVIVADKDVRICVGFDVLLIDFPGIRTVLADWGHAIDGTLDEEELIPAAISTLQNDDPAVQRDRDFWSVAAPELPGSPWDLSDMDLGAHTPPRFKRAEGRIPEPVWTAFKTAAQDRGLSAPGALMALFAESLRLWGANERFCVVTTLFDALAVDTNGVGDTTRTALVDTFRYIPGEPFVEYALRVSQSFWDSVEHSTVPASVVVRDFIDHDAPYPAFPVVFTTSFGPEDHRRDGWLGERVFGVSQTPQVLFDAIHWEEEGALVLAWDHIADLDVTQHVPAMQQALTTLVRRLAEDVKSWDEPGLFLDPWGRQPEPTIERSGVGPALTDPVIEALNEAPHRAAVVQGDRVANAAEVLTTAADTQTVLAQHGVEPGEPVMVLLSKSIAQIGTVIGINAAGAAYVPVDPKWPVGRIERIAARSRARIAIIEDGYRAVPEGVTAVTVSQLQSAGRGQLEPVVVPPEQLAYVIFTSGSTGEPKGVAVEHGQARTTIDDITERFQISSRDVVFGISSLSFDLSVWDVFGMLGAGGTLVLPEAGTEIDPGAWLGEIQRHGVTVWNSAPALAEMLVDFAEADPEWAKQALAQLRLVLLSGDWIPVTLPDRLRALAPNVNFVSLGGATEAAIWSIHHVVGEVDPQWPSIPYGTALSGQWFRILDGVDGAPVPVGTPGELFIGGKGVARGYLGDEKQTNDRFRSHPVYGERLYHTGDEGVWLPDGTIRFLGRVDRQVKVNGYRIELGEIDAALTRTEGIRGGVCVAVPGPRGNKRLVGHVALAPDSGLTDQKIAKALKSVLPAYMIPHAIVVHDELPVTSNGKIDYKTLPNPFVQNEPSTAWPSTGADATTTKSTPADTTPEPNTVSGLHPALAALIPSGVDPELDPLAAGLDSLTVVRIANMIEDQTGKRPPVGDLLTTPIAQIFPSSASPDVVIDVTEPAPQPTADSTATPSDTAPIVSATGRQGRSFTPRPNVDASSVVTGRSTNELVELAKSGTRVEIRVDAGAGPLATQLQRTGQWLAELERDFATSELDLRIVAGEEAKELCTVVLSVDAPAPERTALTQNSASVAPRTEPATAAGTVTADQNGSADENGSADRNGEEPVDPVNGAPLTEMQLAYLVGRADGWLGKPVHPHYRTEVEIEGLDVDRLGAALNAVVGAHPMLSARITEDGKQVIDRSARPTLTRDDLTGLGAEAISAERERCRVADMTLGDDPQRGDPWLQLHATRITPSTWMVVLNLDMLFCDVRGAAIIAKDLIDAYNGRPITTPQNYFLIWANERATATAAREKAKAESPSSTAVPAEQTSRPVPVKLPVQQPDDVVFVRRRRTVDAATMDALLDRCRTHRTTPDAVLVTLLGTLLATPEGERPPTVVTVLDRPDEHHNVVGEYTTTLILDPPPGETIETRCTAATATLLDGVMALRDNDSVHGNARIREHLKAGGGTGSLPVVYSSGLGYWEGEPATCDALTGLGQTVHSISSTPQVLFDLQSFRDADGSLILIVDAVDGAFPDGVIDEFLEALETTVRSLAGDDQPWTAALPGPVSVHIPRRSVSELGVQHSRSENTVGGWTPEEAHIHVTTAVAAVLGREITETELDTGFFQLGLTSLDLVRLRRDLRTAGANTLELTDFFANPNASALIVLLSTAARVESANDEISDALTAAQKRGARRRAVTIGGTR